MKKDLTIFILSHNGSPVRHLGIPAFLFKAAAGFLLIFLIAASVFIIDYRKSKKKALYAGMLEKRIVAQNNELAENRNQIADFARKINGLKKELADLRSLERKIRVLTDMDQGKGEASLFGVGGELPSDIKATVAVNTQSLVRNMHSQVEALDLAAKKQKKDFEKLLASVNKQLLRMAATPTIKPVSEGWVTSGFGYRKSPFTGLKEFHKGLDIATRFGDPIYATADGRVSFVGRKGNLGLVIVVDHGHGLVTRYGHTSKVLKKVGDLVKRGEVIARVGRSGRTTGPHVHYEVILNGICVNPSRYILN